MRTLLVAAALALTAGCAPSSRTYANNEFVCEADGKLSERHVDVDHANPHQPSDWYIQYYDGGKAFYTQVPGETCRVDRW